MAPFICPVNFMMPTASNKVLESFLHPVVTLVAGMLTYNTLVDRIYQVLYNTASMQTTLGGGKLGFLALTVYTTVYTTLSATPFKKTSNPGPAPTITPNATVIDQIAIRYKFTLET